MKFVKGLEIDQSKIFETSEKFSKILEYFMSKYVEKSSLIYYNKNNGIILKYRR